VVLLVNHYVGNGSSFAFWGFAGQIVVLVVGVLAETKGEEGQGGRIKKTR
jgi:hypothetical protein